MVLGTRLPAVLSLALLPTLVAATAPCTPGTYSTSGNGEPPCAPCTAGTYTNTIMQNACKVCPAGSYSGPRSSSCSSCPVGTYALPGSGVCSTCPQGTYSTSVGAGSCLPCPAGSYCTGTGQTSYTQCPAGTYTSVPGESACTACPAGSFAPFEGSTQCCSCCSGFYSDAAGQTECQSCPIAGSYSPVGATDASQCRTGIAGGLTTCFASSTDHSCPTTGGAIVSQAAAPIRRRNPKRRACPAGHQSCPVYGSTLRRRGYLKGYECVDVQNDLESCGGCVAHDSPFGERTAGGGRDCSAIPNADGVRCVDGACVIAKCEHGYVLSPDGENCVDSLAIQA
ncbi:hypothetical protein C8Q77DRAFT_1259496 [Trametes polyzona]|nr:hypothetical protein C8Q77DRAFT_1259496 [Trametes polyzona]